jgi:hypothetical protein
MKHIAPYKLIGYKTSDLVFTWKTYEPIGYGPCFNGMFGESVMDPSGGMKSIIFGQFDGSPEKFPAWDEELQLV